MDLNLERMFGYHLEWDMYQTLGKRLEPRNNDPTLKEGTYLIFERNNRSLRQSVLCKILKNKLC